MNVFFEHLKDPDRNVHSILSDVIPMKPLAADQQIAHAKASICAQCNETFAKKEQKDETSLPPERPLHWPILQYVQSKVKIQARYPRRASDGEVRIQEKGDQVF